ncbi:Uncharacterised protein [Enterobacter hormaechei]|nr:Uncharacterised protein [Enterobacter hormaechei]
MKHRLQRGAQQAADHPAGGEVPDIISVDRRQPTGGEDQRQGANQAQRNGKIIDVVVVLSMTPGKPASANNDDGKGISHHSENEKERVRKPGTGNAT